MKIGLKKNLHFLFANQCLSNFDLREEEKNFGGEFGKTQTKLVRQTKWLFHC